MGNFWQNLQADPNFQAGLAQLSTPRMTLTQAQINNATADSQYKQQKAQQDILSGQALQQYLATGNPMYAQTYLMMGGNPNAITANIQLQQATGNQAATQAYQSQYGQPGQFRGLGMGAMPTPAAPPPIQPPPPMPVAPPAIQQPQVPVNAAPQSNAAPAQATPLDLAANNLRAANQKLAAAAATGNPSIQAAVQAERDQAKVEYDAAKSDADAQRNMRIDLEKQKQQPPNEYQGKSNIYANRMANSEPIIAELGASAGTDIKQHGYDQIPVIGNLLENEDFKKLRQAERDWLSAVLRQESGATIRPEELDEAGKQYFPRPGDTPAVIEQKRINRMTAQEGMTQAAGPGFKRISPVPPDLAAKGITAEDLMEYQKDKQ